MAGLADRLFSFNRDKVAERLCVSRSRLCIVFLVNSFLLPKRIRSTSFFFFLKTSIGLVFCRHQVDFIQSMVERMPMPDKSTLSRFQHSLDASFMLYQRGINIGLFQDHLFPAVYLLLDSSFHVGATEQLGFMIFVFLSPHRRCVVGVGRSPHFRSLGSLVAVIESFSN